MGLLKPMQICLRILTIYIFQSIRVHITCITECQTQFYPFSITFALLPSESTPIVLSGAAASAAKVNREE